MTSPLDELSLAAGFGAATLGQWQELVRDVLVTSGVRPPDRASAESSLSSRTYDGITIQPLYTAADRAPAAGFPGLPPFVRGGKADGGITHGWDVRQRHADPDPKVTNRAMLTDLENGVTSLWLVVGEAGVPLEALDAALDGVLLNLAAVVLDAGADYRRAAQELLALHGARGISADEVRGNLGADPLGVWARTGRRYDIRDAAELAVSNATVYRGLRTIVVDGVPYHTAGGSDAEELACSIASGVAYLRALTDAGLSVAAAAAQLEFRYAVGDDQFLAVAKLRAARRLWSRVTEVCGAPRAQLQHAVTSPAMMTRNDPWVNMLRVTVAAFGAGVGGADAVTVAPFDAALGLPDDLARRIARNTSAILLDETRLSAVIDPAGGSWYVERLTDELARTAWAWFTEIEAAGGMEAALESGAIAERLAGTREKRTANLVHRRDALTGVSEFPNLVERLPVRKPASETPGGGLPNIRYAEQFEALRSRSDSYLSAKDKRPRVFLATLGLVTAHTARAGFAANLFAAGGIEAINPGAMDDVVAAFSSSGVTVACLCGADSAYGDRPELVGALKRAGASHVLLVGKPNPIPPEVDALIYPGCDALQILTDTLDVLEST